MSAPRPIIQPSPYEHPYGDIIYGNYAQFLRAPVSKTEFFKGNILYLSYFNTHPWEAAAAAQLDLSELRALCTYECPFTQYNHTALIPLAILADDVTKYFGDVKPWFYEMACDSSWNTLAQLREALDEDDHMLHDVAYMLMGPGYTDMCYPSDGGKSRIPLMVDLDNGDRLLMMGLVWHNK